jgi:hypothetical protein
VSQQFRIILILILILIASASIISPIQAQTAKKAWSDGKLTWDDFRERPGIESQSELIYRFQTRTETQKIDGIMVKRIRAIALMDPSLSWANPSGRTDQMLRYHQVMFDMIELHRRLMQIDLDRISNTDDATLVFDRYFDQHSVMVSSYQQETRYGELEKMIARWETKIADSLAATPEPRLPDYDPEKLGFGMHLTIGGGTHFGSIANHLSANGLIGTGFQLIWDQYTLNASILSGYGMVREAFADAELKKGGWYEGNSVEFSIGYLIERDDRPTVMPFVGLHILALTKPHLFSQPRYSRGYGFAAGIQVDWLIQRSLMLVQNSGDQATLGVHHGLRLMVATAEFEPDLRGTGVFLSYGFYLRNRGIQVK